MPYLLRASKSTYVNLGRAVTIESGDDFVIRVVANFLQNENYWRAIGGVDKDATFPRVLIFGGGRTRLTDSSNQNYEWVQNYNISAVDMIEFKRVSGVLDLYLDGVKQPGTKTGNTSSFYDLKTINANYKSISSFECDYKKVEFEVNGSLIRSYQKTAITDTGDRLFPDLIGNGNDGTVIGPVEWVEYGGSGLDDPAVTGSANVDGLTVSGVAGSEIDDPAVTGSANVDGLTVSGVAGSEIDDPAVIGSANVDGLTVSGVAGSEIDDPAVIGSANVDGLTVSGVAGSEIDDPAVTGSANVDGLTVSGVAGSEIDAPAVTGSANVDGLTVSGVAGSEVLGDSTVIGSANVDGLTVSGVAGSEVDAPAVTGSANVDGLTVSGVAGSEIDDPAVTGSANVDGLTVSGVAGSEIDDPAVTGSANVDGLTVRGWAVGGEVSFGVTDSNTLIVGDWDKQTADQNRLDVPSLSNILYIEH